jgi:hypothetical protein
MIFAKNIKKLDKNKRDFKNYLMFCQLFVYNLTMLSFNFLKDLFVH